MFEHHLRRDEPLGQPDNTPHVLQTDGIKEPLHFFGPGRTCVGVSDKFRALIEDFEPGVHEFWPVRLVNGRQGRGVAGTVLMRVRRYISALIVSLSGVLWHKSGPTFILPIDYPKDFYFNARQIKQDGRYPPVIERARHPLGEA